MRVLVTGSGGYIGSVLAPFLMESGHDVLGVDTGFYRGCDFGASVGDVPTIDRDVRKMTLEDFEGFDAVVHLAALSNDPLGDLAPSLTSEINAEATVAVARLAREAGVRRFVFASSCSMYGASGSDDPLDESAPLRPLTPYAESKVRSEEGLFDLAGADFAPVSMRNATVYGVSPRLRLDIVLNNLAGWSHTTGSIRLLSDGTAWRPMVHVRDVAAATLGLLEAPEDAVRGEAFNIGSAEQNYRIRDLAEVLSEVSGCEVEIAPGSEADKRSYRVSFERFASAFPAATPEWNARRGAEELVDAYRANHLTKEEFDGDRYVRLRRLRHLMEAGALDDDLYWRRAA
jgi:nucleoside-diphosphate-sugar epimerase